MVRRLRRSKTAAAIAAQIEAAQLEWREAWKRGPVHLRWTELPVQVGDPAPDLELEDSEGESRRLGEFWREQPALLIFWRHFGCGCGNIRAERLRREHSDYVGAGANVLVVGQGEPERSAAYAERFDRICPVLCDPDFVAYRAYGLLDGLPAQVMYDASDELRRGDPEAGIRLADQRSEEGRPLVDSPWQLPGEFVIDRGGTIRLAYRYQYCEDFPDWLVLAEAIRAASQSP